MNSSSKKKLKSQAQRLKKKKKDKKKIGNRVFTSIKSFLKAHQRSKKKKNKPIRTCFLH
jgi:hypothetical protein